MIIAAWNVNSLNARLTHLLKWLHATSPDIVLLQETKTIDERFPFEPIGDAGYNVAAVGQKTYNGVAVLSKQPIDILSRFLPGDDADTQARYLEVFTGSVRVASIYAPNGNPVESEKFAYKLAWLDRLFQHSRTLLASEDAVVLGGDFNIAPTDEDVYDPPGWRSDALCRPESRSRWRQIRHLGWTDAIRSLHPGRAQYTWWDYRGGAWPADQGLRIDHLLLSPQAADRLRSASIDRSPRGWDKASDHTPVLCDLDG
ncbi:MAG: exodeoxyribonuclease III [Rhodospirillales bacterium]|nr:exodeoxyribonuclease III [Rhodospirillales bacterium]